MQRISFVAPTKAHTLTSMNHCLTRTQTAAVKAVLIENYRCFSSKTIFCLHYLSDGAVIFHTALRHHGRRKKMQYLLCLSVTSGVRVYRLLLCVALYLCSFTESRHCCCISKPKPESLFLSVLHHLKISIKPWQHPRCFALPLQTQKTRFLCSVNLNPALQNLNSYLSHSAFSITNSSSSSSSHSAS